VSCKTRTVSNTAVRWPRLACTEEALLYKIEIRNIESNEPEAVSVSLWKGSVATTLTLAFTIRLSYCTTPFATSILQRLRKSWHPTTCCTAVSIACENKPKLHKIIQVLLLCTFLVQTPKHFVLVEILHTGQGQDSNIWYKYLIVRRKLLICTKICEHSLYISVSSGWNLFTVPYNTLEISVFTLCKKKYIYSICMAPANCQ
jgi:hypothetical protein